MKAILIDANSLIYRLYYASLSINKKAEVNKTSNHVDVQRITIKMLYSICFKLVWDKEWDFKIAAFDSKEKLIRKQQFEAYKSNRKPMPDELVELLPTIRKIFSEFGFVLLAKPGYEADDLIGSFASCASQDGIKCNIYTSDHDLLQLIDANIQVCMFQKGISKMQTEDEQTFKEEYGFTPKLMIDYKALAGDNSDFYHGIKGIGPTTAKDLLIKYPGGVSEIYNHLDDLPKKTRELLEKGKDDCDLFKNIATINCSLFTNHNINLFKAKPIQVNQIKDHVYKDGFSAFYSYFNNEEKTK